MGTEAAGGEDCARKTVIDLLQTLRSAHALLSSLSKRPLGMNKLLIRLNNELYSAILDLQPLVDTFAGTTPTTASVPPQPPEAKPVLVADPDPVFLPPPDDPVGPHVPDLERGGEGEGERTEPMLSGPEPTPEWLMSLVDRLDAIHRQLRDSNRHNPWLRPFGEPPVDDLDERARWLWQTLNLVSLRMADTWLKKDLLAIKDASTDSPAGSLLPPVPDETTESELVTELDPGIDQVVRTWFWLVDHDSTLEYAVPGSTRDQWSTMNNRQRRQWKASVRDRVAAVLSCAQSQRSTILVQLDEQLRSLLPVPLPEKDSWWFTTLRRLPDHIDATAGRAIELVGTTYQSGVTWAADSQGVQIDGKFAPPGSRQNQIAWILRVPHKPTPTGSVQVGRAVYLK